MKASEVKSILTRYSISLRKSRGQTFLIDERVADRKVDYAEISPDDVVLEVGPGIGILTSRLMAKGKKVIAIEKDRRICDYLEDNFDGNLELIRADALEVDYPEFDVFVSNLPFNISSPLIFKLLEYPFRTAVVMVQHEFGERMVAAHGSNQYSRLSVNIQYRAYCEIMEVVPKSRFWPQPNVDTAIVKMVPHPPEFDVRDEQFFHELVNILFQHRRKMIGTTLRKKGVLQKEQLKDIPFARKRVEKLSPEDIGELANTILSLR